MYVISQVVLIMRQIGVVYDLSDFERHVVLLTKQKGVGYCTVG